MSLWGGRFSSKLDPRAWDLNASIAFDQRLGPQDVRGSRAWASALVKAGVLTVEEGEQIDQGLDIVGKELENGEFVFQGGDEDIHSAVERRLGELIGELAGKLHTGRSRNDQVATDFRLWMLDNLPTLEAALIEMQEALVYRAEKDMGVIMPGYTHLQRAQPVLLSHWWLGHFWPLARDRKRLNELATRTSVMPLGAGALAGTPLALDRFELASELGFAHPAQNSMDAVSDRDFAAEFLFCASMVGIHLSRLAEAVTLFSSAEFGFFELSDAFSTGSSLMPQKKNPDIFELARGKAGTLLGYLTGLLAVLKGLPSAYDKDLQEDKIPVFSAFDTLENLLPALAGALHTLSIHSERMKQAIDPGLMTTDLADYLVEKGVPFREAHALVGLVVRRALYLDVGLDELEIDEYQAVSAAFEQDLYAVFDPESCVARRKAFGGTAPEAVEQQIKQARALLEQA